MPLKQVGSGLSKEQREERKLRKEQKNQRKRSLRNISKERIKALTEQGFQVKDRIFLDIGNYGILKQLRLNTSYNVSKYIVDAHGSLMQENFKVPDNIVLMYLGVLGNITFTNSLEQMDGICNGNVIPNTIILPGEDAPNVSLSGEYNKMQISGIFECGSVHKRVLNNFLVPKQDVIDSYKNDKMFDIMKDPDTGKYLISTENNYRTTLKRTVHAISKLLNKNTYAFVYLESCLGGICNLPLSNNEFNTIVNPEKFNTLRTGDTLYNQSPYRLYTTPGIIKHDDDVIKIKKMKLAKDNEHQDYRIMLKHLIEKYQFNSFVYFVYVNIENYYEYDVDDFLYFLKLVVRVQPEDDVHFSGFIKTHQKILKAFTKQNRDDVFKLTRRENAIRYNINPFKYSFLALKYGMTDILLEHIPLLYEDDEIQVSINVKNINDLAKKLSKKQPMFSGMFLKKLWEQYIKYPVLQSHDDTLFSDFWFSDQEKLENLKKKTKLTRSEDKELKSLQKQHDYYTITFLMVDIIETIDLYKENDEGRINVFKSSDIPSYNMVYAKQLMTMAIEYVSSDDYRRREIAYKDKIIKQLEDMNNMIENHGSQAGGGGDFLTSLFRFFGF